MKKIIYLSLFLSVKSVIGQVDWENPKMIGQNKLPSHATFDVYSSLEKAKQMEISDRILSLNGIWKFHWSKNPGERPVKFYNTGYDINGWSDIVVPGNWQTQGFGKPIYTNIKYPFKKDPPFVMGEPENEYYSFENRNPVGSYKRTFEIDKIRKNEKVHIHFAGVKSAMYLWINGQKVGYSQGSMTPAEFDVTPYIQKGRNEIAVEVYRWSDGSYLEDQDMWRLSGIYRDVYLIFRPEAYIEDFYILTDLDGEYENANLSMEIDIKNASQEKKEDLSLEIKYYDGRGEIMDKALFKMEGIDIVAEGSEKIKFEKQIKSPLLWSDEAPNLYKIILVLKNKRGKVQETIPWKFGFREVEHKNNQVFVNGKSFKIKGVNRHEHHPRMGRYVDRATMIKDVELIKQCNINLVRTSHYPNDPYFYKLCDEYGIFVMDEANQESHDFGMGSKVLGDNPDWKAAHVDRGVSMVERDKNHACIIIWSLGNEGGSGRNIKAMKEEVLAIDSTKPIFYHADNAVSDLRDADYPTPREMMDWMDDDTTKMLTMREYSHAMGNSLGNFYDYWPLIYNNELLLGGCIWDFVDQGLAKKKEDLVLRYDSNPSSLSLKDDEYWAFGGDFGDMPNDQEFCVNGLIGPDRVPNPHFFEAQKVYQSIWMSPVDLKEGIIKIDNKHLFTKTDAFDATMIVLENGREIKRETLDIPSIRPADVKEFKLPVGSVQMEQGNEYIARVEFSLKEDTKWAKKGFVISNEEFVLKPLNFVLNRKPETNGDVEVNESDMEIIVSGEGFSVTLDKKRGALKSLKKGEMEYLESPLEPYFWKPVNNNQERNEYEDRLGKWKDAYKKSEIRSVELFEGEGYRSVVFDVSFTSIDATLKVEYFITGQGKIKVLMDYVPTSGQIPLIPKFGMHMGIPKDLSNITWYGRGPHENYIDRKKSAMLGIYNKQLEEFITPYISTQDNANREDNRWVVFSHSTGHGIRIDGLQPFALRAWPYLESDLEETKHDFELPDRDFINVNIDKLVHGVGGSNSWGKRTLPQYTIDGNKQWSYGFVISVF